MEKYRIILRRFFFSVHPDLTPLKIEGVGEIVVNSELTLEKRREMLSIVNDAYNRYLKCEYVLSILFDATETLTSRNEFILLLNNLIENGLGEDEFLEEVDIVPYLKKIKKEIEKDEK